MIWVFTKGVTITIVFVVVVQLIGGVFVYNSARNLRDDATLVTHTYEVLDTLEGVISTMKDAETGERGYLLTGDPAYLEPYNAAVVAIKQAVANLKQLTKDNPQKQAIIPVLNESVTTKLNHLEETIALQRTDPEAARREVLTGFGKEAMDTIRAQVDVMRQEEFDLLAVREQRSRYSYVVLVAAVATMVLAGLVLVGVLLYQIRNHLRQLKRAHEALNKVSAELNRTLDTAATGLTHCSRDLRYLSVNPAYARWIELPSEEIIGKSIVDVMGQTAFDVIRPRIERVLRGEQVEFEDELPIGGALKSVHVVYTPDRDASGEVVGWVASVMDVTERVHAERELAKAKVAAEQANEQKDYFLAVLGHELRNPLAPIRNSVELLKHLESLDPTLLRVRDVIDRQVAHMARLIDDLLDVSRISRGKITLRKQEIELTELVEAVIEDNRPQLEGNGKRLEFQAPETQFWVYGDTVRLKEVVNNLLENANKFTDTGGHVDVKITESRNGEALVTVTDTGIGMDAETLDNIFEPFTQADSSMDRRNGGLGLGLALARALIQMHGGEMRAESQGMGKGSRFLFTLPLIVYESKVSPHASSSGSYSVRRILVIEDNQDSAESLQMLLQVLGHTVWVALSGTEGVALARQHKPDLVLCDLGLPGMNGYEVAETLRADPMFRSTYLVALTGYGLEEDKHRAKESGFDYHITKPTDLDVLERLLAQ